MFRYFLGLSWLCVVASASWAADRPNILFVVFDDLNTHVSAAGYEHIRTPGFDAIAADAMTFGRAYCQYPVCGPSRASFLSGLYPESSGVLQQKDDIREKAPGLVTLPEFLRRSGYWTARTGKIYHNEKMNPRETAWDESPERFDNDTLAVEQEARAAFVAKFGPPTRKNRDRYKAFVAEYATQLRGQTTPGYGPTDLDDDGHKDGKNALQVDAWLRERAFGDKP
ncbi:MAG: sulfatase-like hydrolase/transferase, partial [Planctomycetota bacterium]